MFESILLAVDVNDPDGAERSTAAAISMARHENAVLHLLNVVPDTGMAIVSSSLETDHGAIALEKSEAAMLEWAETNIPPNVKHEVHIARGTVYDQIIKTADALGVDGIFVGAHSPALKDYLIGPNAARVARHAEQSVFVIR